MHGLKMVSTPARKTMHARIMGLRRIGATPPAVSLNEYPRALNE
jgi:hypothetical protein